MAHGLSFTFLICVYLYVHVCAGTCLYADEHAHVCVVYNDQGTGLAVVTQMPFILFKYLVDWPVTVVSNWKA